MRRLVQGTVLAAITLLAGSSAMAYTGSYVPGSGINLTPHDLSVVHNGMDYTAEPADPHTRICIFCHAPHNTYRLSAANGGHPGSGPQAADEFTYLPLWNHQLPDPVPDYYMYANGPGAPQQGPKASQAILQGIDQPGSVSLLCLSCHDGSIAANTYGNSDQPPASQSVGTKFMAPGYQIGLLQNLENHHPITFDYDVVVAGDTEIRDPDATLMTPVSTVRDHLFGNGAGGTSYLECASCHSVHNKGNSGEMLLWRSDQNSELCLTCHDKGIYTTP